MIEVILTFPTPEGSRQMPVENGRLTIGRGAVDLQFDDNSLSRHHATVYRENDRVWIADENSTNGTFVNDAPVSAAGTPLKNGDAIRLGEETILRVRISVAQTENVVSNRTSETLGNQNKINFVPFIVAGVAILIIGFSIIIVAAHFYNAENENSDTVVTTPEETSIVEAEENATDEVSKPSPKPAKSIASANSDEVETIDSSTAPSKSIAPDKTYVEMSADEKRQFVERESERVARMIGNRASEAVSPEAAAKIAEMVDGYARRLRAGRQDSCAKGVWTTSDLRSVLERGQKNAHFIVRSFNSEAVSPEVGLYLAMIESEFCPCLQSSTGPLGMFQITKAKADENNLRAIANASPENPDERCEPEKAAAAAARIMKAAMGRFGTGPSSVALAVAGYNSGEGGLSRNLNTALDSAAKKERNFWTLMLAADKLSAQFQKENRKYVPKFFAAAIIGENPRVFGVDISPLSTAIR